MKKQLSTFKDQNGGRYFSRKLHNRRYRHRLLVNKQEYYRRRDHIAESTGMTVHDLRTFQENMHRAEQVGQFMLDYLSGRVE